MKKKTPKNSGKQKPKGSPQNNSKRNKGGRKPGPQPLSKETRVELYIDYLADPENYGGMTKTEFARKVLRFKGNNVLRSLSDYQHEKGFWDAVWDRFTNYHLQGQLPEINRKVVEKAKAGSQWAIELVLKMAKRLEDRIGEGPKVMMPDKVVVTIDNEPRNKKTKDQGD